MKRIALLTWALIFLGLFLGQKGYLVAGLYIWILGVTVQFVVGGYWFYKSIVAKRS